MIHQEKQKSICKKCGDDIEGYIKTNICPKCHTKMILKPLQHSNKTCAICGRYATAIRNPYYHEGLCNGCGIFLDNLAIDFHGDRHV